MEIYGHFQTNVKRALEEIDPNYMAYNGLIICGSHDPKSLDIESLLAKIWIARATGRPFLGICFGHQLAVIQYARDVLGISDATSQEFSDLGTFVIKKRPALLVGQHPAMWLDGARESFWSKYEEDAALLYRYVKDKPKNFLTEPFHPEYQSCIGNPHPLLVKFLELCKTK